VCAAKQTSLRLAALATVKALAGALRPQKGRVLKRAPLLIFPSGKRFHFSLRFQSLLVHY